MPEFLIAVLNGDPDDGGRSGSLVVLSTFIIVTRWVDARPMMLFSNE